MAIKKGRRPFIPTKQDGLLVKILASAGVPVEDICKAVINPDTGRPVDKKTIYKYFRNDLEGGKVQALARVANNLFRIATGNSAGSTTAAIFWLKCQGGWREQSPKDQGGAAVELPEVITIVGVDGKKEG